jgi:hypothetical protein
MRVETAKLTPTGTEILKAKGLKKKTNGKSSAYEPINFTPISGMQASTNTPSILHATVQPSPEAAPKPLKIALIGTAPSSRLLAPFNDPDWQIWACSPGNMDQLPRVDVWFEIHSNLLWPECESYGRPYVEWLKKQTFPIYMQDQRLVPNATPLPIQDLLNEFGRYFFTSSFAYMLAMAIKAGAKEIALFGIDMASKDEYIQQRSGGHYFMQEAAKRGIVVNVPYESDLAQPPPLYGYADSTPFGRKLYVREQELKGRIQQAEQQLAQLNGAVPFLKGALEDMDYMRSIFGGVQT